MIYAWIENNILCITKYKEYANENAIEFNCTEEDLIIDNETIRIKTSEELEKDKKQKEKQEALQKLAGTDTKMARVVEDVINVLVAKKVIDIKDLPQEAVDKLEERKMLREKLK